MVGVNPHHAAAPRSFLADRLMKPMDELPLEESRGPAGALSNKELYWSPPPTLYSKAALCHWIHVSSCLHQLQQLLLVCEKQSQGLKAFPRIKGASDGGLFHGRAAQVDYLKDHIGCGLASLLQIVQAFTFSQTSFECTPVDF